MTTHQVDERSQPEGIGTSFRRRGFLAAAWAAVLGIVAKQTEQPVTAEPVTANGNTQGSAFLCGLTNTETAGGQMTWAGASPAGPTVLLLGNDSVFSPTAAAFPAATGGWAGGTGSPFAEVPNGVYGYTSANTGNGVVGVSVGAGNGFGVLGQSYNSNGSGVGVRGEIPNGTSANAIAVYGLNYSSYAGPGPGAGGFGVYGLSAKGHGLVGATSAAGAAAVVGATNGVAGAYAAVFYGPVVVSGAFTVVGGPKSAAVPHPDGSHRLLYCVESPESWFEDFGEGQLVSGKAEVSIDPDFAAVADLANYHVFITDHARQHPSVTERTPTGFTVEADMEIAALKGKDECDLVGTFSWRVVAKRKDIAGERLARITIPPEPNCPVPPPSPGLNGPQGVKA